MVKAGTNLYFLQSRWSDLITILQAYSMSYVNNWEDMQTFVIIFVVWQSKLLHIFYISLRSAVAQYVSKFRKNGNFTPASQNQHEGRNQAVCDSFMGVFWVRHDRRNCINWIIIWMQEMLYLSNIYIYNNINYTYSFLKRRLGAIKMLNKIYQLLLLVGTYYSKKI